MRYRSRIRVLINAFSARLGGGQTYLTNLLEFLPEEMLAEVYILAPDSLEIPEQRSNIHRVRVHWPVKNPVGRAIWEKMFLRKLARTLEADVLFCPGGLIGPRASRDCRSVMAFQNMMPFDLIQRKRYPLGYTRVRNWLLKGVTLRSMAKADKVICISEFGRQVIERHAPELSGKTAVIPHGVGASFRRERAERPEWLPREDYILYVSILDVYKAQIEVLRAFALLKLRRRKKEKLVFAGPQSPYYTKKVRKEIKRLGLENDVLLAGPVPYTELPALYQNALINIFASECENCPNILLEALASGRPLFASNRPPMPELGGDAAIYFDPSAPAELAEKLLAVIDDPTRLKELSAKARTRSQLYDWEQSARSTWTAISELVSAPASGRTDVSIRDHLLRAIARD